VKRLAFGDPDHHSADLVKRRATPAPLDKRT
jgi:hypothetical protein